jgi:hypothetical protein
MTPARWALLILAALSGVVVAYALFIDSSSIKLPLLVSSLAVFGIALALPRRQGDPDRLPGRPARARSSWRGGHGDRAWHTRLGHFLTV